MLAIAAGVTISAQAQETMLLHNGSNVMYHTGVSQVDSIKFLNGSAGFHQSRYGKLDFPITSLDSLTFDDSSNVAGAIYIIYNDTAVTIINPYATQGISITANKGVVTATSTITTANIVYNILGNSSNGALNLSTAQPARLVLSNVSLTNTSGAAVKITGNGACTLFLSANTVNKFSDATTSTANATILADRDIIIAGAGTLSVSGFKKHAISNGTSFIQTSGTLNIPAAASDGIHTGVYVQNDGSITIAPTGDGVDAGTSATINGGSINVTATAVDMKGIKSDGSVVINGGVVTVNVSGNQSKGVSSKANITVNGGSMNITASGSTVLTASGSGYDASYSTAFKADSNIVINGGDLTLSLPAANDGGKGLSADGNITVKGGTMTVTTSGTGKTYTNVNGVIDSYAPCGIKSDKHIYLLGGVINTTSSGGAGKCISADSTLNIGATNASDSALILNATTSGGRFLVSGTGQNADYANPKAIKSEGVLIVNSGIINISCTQTVEGGEGLESKSMMYIKGGRITANTYDDCINAATHLEISGGKHFLTARGNDGVDCNGTMTISGGLTISNGARAPEEGFDCDNNTFKVLGGVMIGTGGNTSTPTAASSTQNSIKLTGAAGTAICIRNASNAVVLMYQMPAFSTTGGGGSSMVTLLSDPNLANGTYTLQYGGTISGGSSFANYNTGGTYSGGSSKSFTVSARVTSVTY